ncbi:RIB43A-like with coiled-coils protein 1 [Rhinatrema bivittatum]|uniref:RIB43A-like with coiled-coils protein 1 n=1 Tax=Rhinatrema bivittatum TaxID=194408 RepID=UPI00112CE624|nr:RIB43A-like with coiled-coils protein 1 [Rhinatrema bivittatum]XP_029463869.1 RIB43A-like with coiled-coils protein 1 [Rhinatrema bivittatum]XP_029463870.1 RIB43A-like with coiled-coils protein 1 [Rhinatrema bivittatum]XP_029463871.1 RIB43A-like with coiled-coils protein 1 [Rhinatrema bivittatum]
MYKLDLPLDLKDAAAIERRRNREQQRQSRIFNAKVRTIGVDVEALGQQVVERKEMEETEKARNDTFDAQRVECDKVVQMMEERERQHRRDVHQAMGEFWERLQQPNTRREFDLYDPDGLRKDRPARLCDGDPRCGPASLQKFQGEDLNEKTRKKKQQELTHQWLTEQRDEKNKILKQTKYADNLYDKKMVELDERAILLDRMENECRKAVRMATDNFNSAQAADLVRQRQLEKEKDNDDSFAEIHNHLTGDILTENPAAATSYFQQHRVITDRWKGMSPEQLQDIRRTQQQQQQEKQRLREEERQRDMEWETQRRLMARAAMVLEEQEKDLNKQLRQNMDVYNQQLSREQKAQLEYLDKEVYVNNPTAHYYTQFNTSSR